MMGVNARPLGEDRQGAKDGGLINGTRAVVNQHSQQDHINRAACRIHPTLRNEGMDGRGGTRKWHTPSAPCSGPPVRCIHQHWKLVTARTVKHTMVEHKQQVLPKSCHENVQNTYPERVLSAEQKSKCAPQHDTPSGTEKKSGQCPGHGTRSVAW